MQSSEYQLNALELSNLTIPLLSQSTHRGCPGIGCQPGSEALPAGFGALPAGFGALPAGSEALPTGSEALPAGFEAHPA